MNLAPSGATATDVEPAKGVFVGNRWRPSRSGKTIDVVAPATGSLFARIAQGDAGDVNDAVAAARKAFAEGAWGRLAPVERGRLLLKLGQMILDQADALALIEARDTGKPMKQARADIAACARYFEFYGGAADKLGGETIPFLNG
jgi:aldehyde dehydrogenase (NAD+)